MCGYPGGPAAGVPWTFGRAIDDTLDLRSLGAGWQTCPGWCSLLGRVPARPQVGYDRLVDLAAGDLVARLMPGGSLVAEQGAVAGCAPASSSCTWTVSGPPGGSWRATSTPGWSVRGGCCSTTPRRATRAG